MTPEQKRAMEHYSPREKDSEGQTTGFDRSNLVARAEQKRKNYAQAYENRRLNLELRNQLLREKMGTGEYQSQSSSVQGLKREHDLAMAQARNQMLREDISSGRYGSHQQEMARLNEERRQMEEAEQQRIRGPRGAYADEMAPLEKQLEQLKKGIDDGTWQSVQRLNKQLAQTRKEAELTAKYGQLGTFMARNEGLVNAFNSLTSSAMFSIRGRARAGFQGTIEQHQADLADTMLNREIAAIFRPMQEASTSLKKWAARQLRQTSGSQQDLLMLAGLGAIGASGYTTYQGAAWAWNKVRNLGGAPRAAGSLAGEAAVSAAAAAAGTRMAVPAAPAAAARGGFLGRAAGFVGRWAIPAYLAYKGFDAGEDYWDAHRRAGHSLLGSALGTSLDVGTEATKDLFFGLFGTGKDFRLERMKEAGFTDAEINARMASGHRTVTPGDTGFEDIDESFDRLQAKASMVDDWKPTAKAGDKFSASAEDFADSVNRFGAAIDRFAPGYRLRAEGDMVSIVRPEGP